MVSQSSIFWPDATAFILCVLFYFPCVFEFYFNGIYCRPSLWTRLETPACPKACMHLMRSSFPLSFEMFCGVIYMPHVEVFIRFGYRWSSGSDSRKLRSVSSRNRNRRSTWRLSGGGIKSGHFCRFRKKSVPFVFIFSLS